MTRSSCSGSGPCSAKGRGRFRTLLSYTYTTETYSADDYASMLAARGLEKLAEQLPTMEISADLGQGLMQYGTDYQLGDIVPIKHTRYGLTVSARISQAKTVYERGGKIVTVVLDDYTITQEALSL